MKKKFYGFDTTGSVRFEPQRKFERNNFHKIDVNLADWVKPEKLFFRCLN